MFTSFWFAAMVIGGWRSTLVGCVVAVNWVSADGFGVRSPRFVAGPLIEFRRCLGAVEMLGADGKKASMGYWGNTWLCSSSELI